jgi:hypothetical protein
MMSLMVVSFRRYLILSWYLIGSMEFVMAKPLTFHVAKCSGKGGKPKHAP